MQWAFVKPFCLLWGSEHPGSIGWKGRLIIVILKHEATQTAEKTIDGSVAWLEGMEQYMIGLNQIPACQVHALVRRK